MSSILTNSAAQSALQTLRNINANLETTQNRVASGLKVATASDNAAYWSISSTMKSDNGAHSAVKDALGLGAGKVDTAYTAITEIKSAVEEIKSRLVTAQGASADDQLKLKEEITSYQKHITAVAEAASYAGTNLLANVTFVAAPGPNTYAAVDDLGVVASFNRTGQSVAIGTIDITGADTQVLGTAGILGSAADAGTVLNGDLFTPAAGTAVDPANIKTALDKVEAALEKLATAASTLGAAKTRIDLQTEFVSNLSDAIDRGVGKLVDADMEAESSRLAALQTQQQLGVQALSIANSTSQSILNLFR